MRIEFTAPPYSYKPESSATTPFLRARQEWDDRIGSTVVQAKNWRLAFFASTVVSLLLLSLLGYQSTQRRVIPVVVGLDRERGEAVFMGRANSQPYQPQLQEIKFFLTHFITLVRAVPSDPVLIKRNWLNAYQFLRPKAANALNEIANQDPKSPLKRIGEETLTLQPMSVTQVAGGSSYQVRWEETAYNSHGVVIERYIMNGVFTIEVNLPDDEKVLAVNPLGVFITNFQWNREL